MHELHQAHHQMKGTAAPRCLELQLHLSGSADMQPFFWQRRLGGVTAQLLQLLAVIRLHAELTPRFNMTSLPLFD
jgi:hypothetical protein